MKIIQRILSTNPAFIISRWLTIPVPKAIALGGVATGSIKAQEAPSPMMSESPKGLTPTLSATDINIGTNRAALAVFEVNSVRKIIKVATKSPITKWLCPAIRN